jgi:hypothetical protein
LYFHFQFDLILNATSRYKVATHRHLHHAFYQAFSFLVSSKP